MGQRVLEAAEEAASFLPKQRPRLLKNLIPDALDEGWE
jgi:hypothetical protein